MARHRKKIAQVFFSKGLFFVFVVLLLFFSFSLLREVKNKSKIKAEILSLEQDITKLDSDNEKLQSLIDYLKTDEYAELAAKEKLGMKKEGEKVILVTENEDELVRSVSVENRPSSNLQLWWNYFFN